MQKLPTTLYTAAQVRELDRIIIKDCGIPGIELMGRAGNAVFRHLRIKWPEAQHISIFCGSGNNAGDGYIIAGLALAVGLNVTVYAASDPDNLTDNARIAYQDFIKAKGKVIPFEPDTFVKADIIIDALLGTGLNKPVTGLFAQAIQVINQSRATVIAVDLPSGLNADTGSIMGCAVKASCTVTFIGLKRGLYTGFAADYCGEIVFSLLAVPQPQTIFSQVASTTTLITKKNFPPRPRCLHKGDNGHVLVIGGEQGYSGAARMAAEAALRVGAGLVSLATRPEHSALLNIGRPELMCHGIEGAEMLSQLIEKTNVIVIGPGLGQSKWATELFNTAINTDKILVMDADALNLLANRYEHRSNWVLTPHPGEAARLLNCGTATIQHDRFAAVRAIQSKFGGIAILKGAGTLIASNDDIGVSTSGNPGMASGGMGDVLSGVIAGLVAQGLSLKDSAQQGVHIHGMAADLAAEQAGERGLLASDLLPYLRQLVN